MRLLRDSTTSLASQHTCKHTDGHCQRHSAGRRALRDTCLDKTSQGKDCAGSTIGAAKNNAPIRQSPSRPRNIGAYGTPGNTTSFFAAQPLIVCLQPSLQCDPLAVLVELLLRLSRTWTEEPASYASTQCNMYYWDPIPASMCRKPAAAPILEAVNRRARVEVHASLYVPG